MDQPIPLVEPVTTTVLFDKSATKRSRYVLDIPQEPRLSAGPVFVYGGTWARSIKQRDQIPTGLGFLRRHPHVYRKLGYFSVCTTRTIEKREDEKPGGFLHIRRILVWFSAILVVRDRRLEARVRCEDTEILWKRSFPSSFGDHRHCAVRSVRRYSAMRWESTLWRV